MIGTRHGRAREGGTQMVTDPSVLRACLFSIGHSHHGFGRLVELLRGTGVTTVADVRSLPYSQRLPQFNRPDLQAGLWEHEIGYAFLGDTLGGRPESPALYDADGRVNYERMRE